MRAGPGGAPSSSVGEGGHARRRPAGGGAGCAPRRREVVEESHDVRRQGRRPGRHDEEQRRERQPPGDGRERQQAPAVGPVDVLGHEEHRALGARGLHEVHDLLDDPVLEVADRRPLRPPPWPTSSAPTAARRGSGSAAGGRAPRRPPRRAGSARRDGLGRSRRRPRGSAPRRRAPAPGGSCRCRPRPRRSGRRRVHRRARGPRQPRGRVRPSARRAGPPRTRPQRAAPASRTSSVGGRPGWRWDAPAAARGGRRYGIRGGSRSIDRGDGARPRGAWVLHPLVLTHPQEPAMTTPIGIDPGRRTLITHVILGVAAAQPRRRRTPMALVVAGSLAVGFAAAVALAAAPMVPATESALTGAVLCGFALGWAALAGLSARLTRQPQRWAAAPAVVLGGSGIALLALGSSAHPAIDWVWPPVLLGLALWMAVHVRRDLAGSARAGCSTRSSEPWASPRSAAPTRPSGRRRDASTLDAGPAGRRRRAPPAPELHRYRQPHRGRRGRRRRDGRQPRLGHPGRRPATRRSASTTVPAGAGARTPTLPRTPSAISTDLHTLLQRAGVPGPYVIAGHSFGGLYALTFAAKHPDEVAGLVLIDSTSPHYDVAGAAPRPAASAGLRRGGPGCRADLLGRQGGRGPAVRQR